MRHLTLSALLSVAVIATTATAADHPLVGTWTGNLDERTQRELTIRSVGAQRTVYGWYCIRQSGLHQINDFHGDGSAPGTARALATKQRITTTIRDYRIRATVNRDGDHLDVTAKSRKDKRNYELALTAPETAPCRPRIVPLPVEGVPDDDRPPGETFADVLAGVGPDPHPFVGSWTGSAASGLVLELVVASVDDDGAVQGLYCNIWASGWRATDMNAAIPGAIVATATDRELGFRHEHNGRTFQFTLDTPDTMTYVQTIPGKGSQTIPIVRTDDPTCAKRVIVAATT